MNITDIIARAISVIEESDGADEHGALLTELRGLETPLTDLRWVLVTDSGIWREELSGADVIQDLTSALEQLGLGGQTFEEHQQADPHCTCPDCFDEAGPRGANGGR